MLPTLTEEITGPVVSGGGGVGVMIAVDVAVEVGVGVGVGDGVGLGATGDGDGDGVVEPGRAGMAACTVYLTLGFAQSISEAVSGKSAEAKDGGSALIEVRQGGPPFQKLP